MLKGVKAVEAYMRLNGIKQYRIYGGLRKVPIVMYEESGATEGAIDHFNKWASIVLEGNPNDKTAYLMSGYPKGKPARPAGRLGSEDEPESIAQSNASAKTVLQCEFTLTGIAEGGQQVMNGYSAAPVNIEAEKEKWEKERDTEDELDELRELVTEQTAQQTRMNGLLEQGLQMLIGRFMPAPQAAAQTAPTLSGTPETAHQATQTTGEPLRAIDRLKAVILRLRQRDPQILDNLEKLAGLAEQKPEMYKMAIGYLNSLNDHK